MLTDEQRATFERDGMLSLPGAFPAADAARMQDVVWGELRARYDVRREDRSSWGRHGPTGLKNTKRHRAFDAILSPPVRSVLDDLFGPDGWLPPKHLGNVLVTMPEPGEWRFPHRIWHCDFEYPRDPPQPWVVKVWALFDDVDPGGGGTPQLLGSHRLTERWLAENRRAAERLDAKTIRDRILKSEPWLDGLTHDRGDPGRDDRLRAGADLRGIRVRAVECTGRAGDVFVTHGWVMHSIAANCSTRPRLMRSAAVFRRGARG